MALEDKLKKELERRTQRARPDIWNKDTWFTTPLSRFFGKQLPVVHRAIGECVDNILKPNWQMTVAAWQGLQIAIDGADTPKTALPDMVRAALQVDPRNFEFFEAADDVKKTKKSAPKKPTAKKYSKKPAAK